MCFIEPSTALIDSLDVQTLFTSTLESKTPALEHELRSSTPKRKQTLKPLDGMSSSEDGSLSRQSSEYSMSRPSSGHSTHSGALSRSQSRRNSRSGPNHGSLGVDASQVLNSLDNLASRTPDSGSFGLSEIENLDIGTGKQFSAEIEMINSTDKDARQQPTHPAPPAED